MTPTTELIERLHEAAGQERIGGPQAFELFTKARDALVATKARIAELTEERDQFMEQAAIRDKRDAEMQMLMRINNEVLARAETAEAALMNNWRSIDIPPEEFDEVLVYCPNEEPGKQILLAQIVDRSWCPSSQDRLVSDDGESLASAVRPTHWMRKPSPHRALIDKPQEQPP